MGKYVEVEFVYFNILYQHLLSVTKTIIFIFATMTTWNLSCNLMWISTSIYERHFLLMSLQYALFST
jgi:hypothetical protein